MRRRGPELAVLAAAALFVLLLVFSFRPGRRPGPGRHEKIPVAPASEAAGEATTLLRGFDFTESVRGKPLLRIKADRTIGYGPGAGLAPNLYAGEKVTLTVYPEDGAPVTVLADRADYDERSGESKLQGNVRWSDGEDALAETEVALFHPANRTLEAPGAVHYTKGSASLTAPSARYDLRDRTIHFRGPLEGSGSGEETGGLSKLTAREGLFRRDQGVLELELAEGESVSGDRFAADRLVLKMGQSGGRTEWARANGNVRGILAAGGAAAPKTASKVDRQYTGEESVLTFDPEGKIQSFSLRGAPALLWEPARRLTAKQIDLAFADGRAVSARASGGIRIESEDSVAEAQQGSLAFSKEGAAEHVTLDGEVRIRGDGRRGEGARAVEVDSRGMWLLTGEGTRSARVESGGSRLSADRIEIERPTKQVRGEGRARAVFSPDPQKKEHRTTFVGDPKRPTYGKADRIVLDDASHLATLSGSASLWQDTQSLFADDISLSDSEKTVTAVNNVRAVMTPSKDRATKPEDRASSVVAAKHLFYRDSDRSARFEGGVTFTRGGWRASGGESTAWLDKDGGVDCVEIDGDVHFVDQGAGRSGKAEKAVDFPKQDKTILWGSPARVTDAGGNRAAGAILTIVDRGRSVEITAPEGGKTETIHRTTKD